MRLSESTVKPGPLERVYGRLSPGYVALDEAILRNFLGFLGVRTALCGSFLPVKRVAAPAFVPSMPRAVWDESSAVGSGGFVQRIHPLILSRQERRSCQGRRAVGYSGSGRRIDEGSLVVPIPWKRNVSSLDGPRSGTRARKMNEPSEAPPGLGVRLPGSWPFCSSIRKW
jgi:hypothetical protein